MRHALFAVTVVVLSACAADRYRWNLAHTQLYGGAQLSHTDFEQIVALVTSKSTQPIIGIAPEHAPQDRGRFAVGAGTPREDTPCDYFTVEMAGGKWRIVRHLRPSPAVAMGLVLGR